MSVNDRSHTGNEDEALAPARAVYAGKVFPNLQISTFRNIDRLFPSRAVKRGGEIREIPAGDEPIGDVRIQSGGREFDLYDYVSRNRVAALLIIKDGGIVHEQYEFGLGRDARWMSMSLAKSVSSTLVGAAIAEGAIRSIDDSLVPYLPQLAGGAYDGVSIRHLLQMTSGVRWDETPTDPHSDRRRMLDLQIEQQPGAILDFMAALPRVAEPGTVWNYSTGETHVMGALLKAATGRHVADYLSETIWTKLGMEADATWWLESPGGLEIAGSGISAALRDYGRFGLFAMHGGVIDESRIVPEGWFREAGAPRQINGTTIDYGYMWWPVRRLDGTWDGAFMAAGLFGQFIYIHPKLELVAVVWGARSKPVGAEVIADRDFFNSVAEYFAQSSD